LAATNWWGLRQSVPLVAAPEVELLPFDVLLYGQHALDFIARQ
jgi:hypothetical protein